MSKNNLRRVCTGFLALLGLALASVCVAADTYKPFVAAEPAGSSLDEAVAKVLQKLEAAGIEVLGRYSPYEDASAVVIGTTTAALKKAAAGHAYGGFGGVVRVAVTDNNGAIEVGYVNPVYMGYAYHIGDLSAVAEEYRKALGGGEAFGAKGLDQGALEKYHYMMFMPYFKDRKVIASLGGHAEAVAKVAEALKHPDSDMAEIWRVEIDENQMLFGVRLHGGKWKGAMKSIMDKIDIDTPKSTAALPWELLVSGGELVYLPGKFRIAIMFPDLTMGTFMQISDVPDNMDESAKELSEILKSH